MDFEYCLRDIIEGAPHEFLDLFRIITTNDEHLIEITEWRAPYALMVLSFYLKNADSRLGWFGPTDCAHAIQTKSMILDLKQVFTVLHEFM